MAGWRSVRARAGPGRNPARAPPKGAAIPGLNRFPRISAPKQIEKTPTVRAEIIRLPTPTRRQLATAAVLQGLQRNHPARLPPSPSAPPAE